MSQVARLWCRLPVLVRAALLGCLVLTVGGMATGPLLFANIKLWPAVPWSVPILAVYVWVFWRYVGGRWWPRSTSEARRRLLRANALPLRVWGWALLAGYLAMTSNFALHWIVGRFAPLAYTVPAILQQLPTFTLICMLLMLSAVAGIVEEAAFRGYMQGPIEARHGIVTAIVVVAIVFGAAHLTDLQPSMTIARMFFIVLAAVLYGILVHLTNSILPGIVLHATGDAIGILWIWWLSKRPRMTLSDEGLWITSAIAAVFAAAAVWAFLRLARCAKLATGETEPCEFSSSARPAPLELKSSKP